MALHFLFVFWMHSALKADNVIWLILHRNPCFIYTLSINIWHEIAHGEVRLTDDKYLTSKDLVESVKFQQTATSL